MILWSTAEAVLRPINDFSIIKYFLILWSTAEAVLRLLRIANDIKNLDPMVYCGSGTETIIIEFLIYINRDPMVYCGSGTETEIINIILLFRILWSTAEAVLRQLQLYFSY